MTYPEEANPETDGRLQMSGDSELEGSGKLLLHRCGVSSRGVENVLELDGLVVQHGECTKSPRIVYFKVVKMVNVCEFYFD